MQSERHRKLVKGQQCAQYLRRPAAAKSGGEVILDLNVLAVEDDAKRVSRLPPDGRFDVGVAQTQSRAFIVIHSESKLATEVRLVDAKNCS